MIRVTFYIPFLSDFEFDSSLSFKKLVNPTMYVTNIQNKKKPIVLLFYIFAYIDSCIGKDKVISVLFLMYRSYLTKKKEIMIENNYFHFYLYKV